MRIAGFHRVVWNDIWVGSFTMLLNARVWSAGVFVRGVVV